MSIEWLGLLGGLALLIVLTMRGVDLLIAAPVCALLVALSFGLPLSRRPEAGAASFTSGYMGGFTGFVASWFFVFLLGSVFGKVMEDSPRTASRSVVQRFGARHALVAIVGARAAHLWRRQPVRGRVLGVSAGARAVPPGRPAAQIHPGHDRLWFGDLHDDLGGLTGDPELDPDGAPRHHTVRRVAGGAWRGGVRLRLAEVDGAARSLYDVRDGDPQAKTGGLPHPASGLAARFVLHDTLKQSALIVALLSGVLVVLVVNRKYFVNLSQAVTAARSAR
jgi:uncharacterized membrane protein